MKSYRRLLFQIVGGLVLIGCTHQTANLNSVSPLDFSIIDAHAHFHSDEMHDFHQPSVAMLEEFKKNRVVGAVVHLSSTENRKAEIDRNKGVKFAICAAVVPGQTVSQIEAGIKKGRFQCLKIYLGYIPKYPSDPFYQPFYELAEKHSVPVVFHTGDTHDKSGLVKFADPIAVDEIAVKYRKVNFVIAHLGNPWFHSAAEVIYKNDNVYGDTSALLLGDISKESPEKVDELVVKPLRWIFLYVENPKKLLFATDWPLLTVKPYVEAVQLAIPKEHWRAVFHDNAAELFHLR